MYKKVSIRLTWQNKVHTFSQNWIFKINRLPCPFFVDFKNVKVLGDQSQLTSNTCSIHDFNRKWQIL